MKSPYDHGPVNRHGVHSKHKYCLCGGHNHSNPKKNKNNNSTRNRLLIRLSRKYKRKYQKEILNGSI